MSLYTENTTIGGLIQAPAVVNDSFVPVFYSGMTYRVSLGDIAGMVTKTTIGLGNVDNTSDVNKPISTATQTALNNKADANHTHSIQQVTGLNASLATKASIDHSHAIAEIPGLEATLASKAGLSHEHAMTEVMGLTAALNSKTDAALVNSQLSAKANVSHQHNASDIIGLPAIPADLATQSFVQNAIANEPVHSHSHAYTEISGLSAQLNTKVDTVTVTQQLSLLQTAVNGKAATVHSHQMTDVADLANSLTNLENRVQGKIDTVSAQVTSGDALLTTAIDAKAPLAHGHTIAHVSGLDTALAGKASTVHTHVAADITDLTPVVQAEVTTAVSGKSDVGHTHQLEELPGLMTALLGRAPTFHGHAIEDISRLQSELDARPTNALYALKSDIGHRHEISNIEGLSEALSAAGGSVDTSNLVTKTDFYGLRDAYNAFNVSIQGQVNGKAPNYHQHSADQIYDLVDFLTTAGYTTGGMIRASVAETLLGADDDKGVTPYGLKQVVNGKVNQGTYNSDIDLIRNDILDLQGDLGSKAAIAHTHPIAEVDGLTEALQTLTTSIPVIQDASQDFKGVLRLAAPTYASSTNDQDFSSAVTPAGLADTIAALSQMGNEFYEVTPGTVNFSPDLKGMRNHSWVLTASSTLSAPTDVVPGRSGSILITQDATGSRALSFGSVYTAAGGLVNLPPLSTAAGSVDRIDYLVISATNIQIRITKDFKQ